MKLTAGIDDEHGGRVIDGVIILQRCGFLKENAERGSQLADTFQAARDTEMACTEVLEVIAQYFRCVAFRVNADQYNARQTLCAISVSWCGHDYRHVVHVIFCFMRCAEHCVKLTAGIDDEDGGRVIDGVIIPGRCGFLKENAEPGSQLADTVQAARDTEMACTEVLEVIAQYFWRVAFRVNADQYDARQTLCAIFGQSCLGGGKHPPELLGNYLENRQRKHPHGAAMIIGMSCTKFSALCGAPNTA